MKFSAIIMAPQVIEFQSSGNNANISNQAWALCNQLSTVVTAEDTFVPRLLLVLPQKQMEHVDQIRPTPEPPLVFDPPPMAA